MQLKKGQIVEFDIHALAFGGAGIGKYEGEGSAESSGMTVFVEGTMPGDRVKASFKRIKSKFSEADLVEIVKKSPERVKPMCPYAKECGGCQLQFMPYEKQLEFKKQHVIDAFERIGKIYAPPVSDVIGCRDPFYYRNKMEFSFGYDSDMNFALGMHLPGRRYDILDLKECFLESEFSSEILNKVREFVVLKGWAPYKYSCGEGFLRSLYIREGKRTGDVMINLCTSDELPEDVENGMNEFAEMFSKLSSEPSYKGTSEKRYYAPRWTEGKPQTYSTYDEDFPEGSASRVRFSEVPKVVSICWSQIISKRGVPKQIKEKLLFGRKFIIEKMILENGDELSFDIFPQAFFQINTLQAEILYSQIIRLASLKDHKVVFDLFCGTGTIGLFLSKHCEQVYGIELNEEAIKAARENVRKNNIFNVDFYTGDVNKMLKTLKDRPSLIVVDPPRAGLTEKIVKQINDSGVSQLIYVSCNPSTLARDCAWFSDYGYRVKSIQPVDMFPHTYHIENVCLLER